MGGGGGGLEEMLPIFRQVKAEWSNPKQQLSTNITARPFIFHVHTSKLQNGSALCIRVTDFHSNTFHAVKSVLELEDMRDRVGIGGPWTEFVDYLKGSFTSEGLKLVLAGQSKSGGAVSARIIAQKSDGNPTIAISLTKLVDAAASEEMANITLDLFRLYTNVHELLIKEQQRCYQLSERLSAEKEKNHVLQLQLDASLPSRSLAANLSRHEKNVYQQRELDASPPSQEKNVDIQPELYASPPFRAFAPSVSHQEKKAANQRELYASPPSQAFASSDSGQERKDAIQRYPDASSASRPRKFKKISDLSTSDAILQSFFL